jgi:cytochrome c553
MLSSLLITRCSKFQLAIAAVALVFTAQVSAAGDAARGEVLADTCNGCHAVASYTNVYPTYHVPRVAGQSAGYLASALTLYRDGNRDHSTMTAQAGSLSDQDIQDIAAYLAASGPQLVASQEAQGEAPTAAVVCSACHGAAGVSPIPTNPNLAGQHMDYLEQAAKQYKAGERRGPNAIAMQAQMNAISDEDLKAVLLFYSQQDGVTSLPYNRF